MITKIPFHSSETVQPPIAPSSFNQMARHADGNMVFTNQVNQIRNIDTLHDEEVMAKSADTIKAFLRKTMAAQSYGKMFTEGLRFKMLNQAMPAFKGKANFRALDHLEALSQYYLRDIKAKTPNLNADEKRLLAQVVDSPVTLRHQSNQCLAPNGKLNLLSADKIDSLKMSAGSHTLEHDKIQLANHDFVFFGVEFSEDKAAMPLNQTHMGIDFGANAYLIDNTYSHGYLTLTDHLINKMPFPYNLELNDFASQLSQSLDEVYRYVTAGKYIENVPVFSAKDMKLGLGLYLIDFLRRSKDDSLRAFVFQKALPSKDLDHLINFVFQPEFHVPRMVSTTHFKEVKLREISLEEAVKASNVERLDELVKTQESAREAMTFALEAIKEDIILHLFDRFTFTKEDILLIDKKHELLDLLSLSGAKPSILQLFIDKGFVDDVFGKCKRHNEGKTMLDNAIRYNNKDMIAFLRNLGLQTKEEWSADLKEAVLSSDTARLNRIATSKERIHAALAIAVANKKIDMIGTLLDENQFTVEDMRAIHVYGGVNLFYVLSDKDADINVLRLFLDKCLIDINADLIFNYCKAGCGSMLDNATANGRKDIVSLLKMYDNLKG